MVRRLPDVVAGGHPLAGHDLLVPPGDIAVLLQRHSRKPHGPAVAEVAAGLVVGIVEPLQVQGAEGQLCHKVREAKAEGLLVSGFILCFRKDVILIPYLFFLFISNLTFIAI